MTYRPWFYHEPTNTSEDQYYHYIYYNLPQEYLEISNAGLTFLLAVAFTNTLIGTPANFLKLAMILKEERLRTSRYTHFFYQGIVDLLITAIISPCLLVTLLNGRFSKIGCSAVGWIPLFCYQSRMCSTAILGLMQVVRMWKPKYYAKCLQTKFSVATLTIVVIFGLSLVLPAYGLTHVMIGWDAISMSCDRQILGWFNLTQAVTDHHAAKKDEHNLGRSEVVYFEYYLVTSNIAAGLLVGSFIYLSYKNVNCGKLQNTVKPGFNHQETAMSVRLASKSTSASTDPEISSIFPANKVCIDTVVVDRYPMQW